MKIALTIACWCFVPITHAATIQTTHLTDQLNLNVLSVPTSAQASLKIETVPDVGPSVFWAIGTVTADDVGQEYVLTEATSGTSTVNWAMLNNYLANDVLLTETINASPLIARVEWPLLAAAERGNVLELRFTLEAFSVVDTVGYIAGTYQMTFAHVPEPNTFMLCFSFMVILLRKRQTWQRKRN